MRALSISQDPAVSLVTELTDDELGLAGDVHGESMSWEGNGDGGRHIVNDLWRNFRTFCVFIAQVLVVWL